MDLHLVFDERSYKKAQLQSLHSTDKIYWMMDDLSFGPLGNLYEVDAIYKRVAWLNTMFKTIDGTFNEFDELYKDISFFRLLPSKASSLTSIIIWSNGSVTEQLTICLLSSMSVIHKVPVIKKKGSELLPLTDDMRTKLGDFWLDIREKNGIRVLQDGRIQVVPSNYYDDSLLEQISPMQSISIARVVGAILGKYQVGDSFLYYRIYQLLTEGKITVVESNKDKPLSNQIIKLT